MFIHTHQIKTVEHVARGATYEIAVWQVVESGEYRVHVSKGGFGLHEMFDPNREEIDAALMANNGDSVAGRIKVAKDVIDRNEDEMY